MKSCPFFNKKGNLVKSCRWFSIFDSLAAAWPYLADLCNHRAGSAS